MAPPAGQAPRIPAIVTNGDTNSRVRKVVCILQNAEYRSAVVSGAYSSLISFPAVKISRFNRERKMHARAVGFDSTLSNASRNAVQNCTSIAFAGSEWSEIIDIDGDAYETLTVVVVVGPSSATMTTIGESKKKSILSPPPPPPPPSIFFFSPSSSSSSSSFSTRR